jgi:hypothetical protein
MGAVRHGEGVVDEDVAQRGELRHEIRIVALLARMEAGVLEAEDVAGFHSIHRGGRALADAILRECDRALEKVGDRRRKELERLCQIGPFRTPKMREQDHLATLIRNLPDGRSGALDAGRVRDLAVLDRHVEIDAHEHALATHVGLIERMEHVTAHRQVWGYDARCRKTDSPRLLAYMGRYRSVLYMVATSNLRGPSLGSGMGTRSKQPFTTADMRPVLPFSMAS